MIDDVLKITAGTRDQVELVWERVMISDVLTDAVNEITPLADATGITIDVAVTEAGVRAHADGNKLRVVLHHLLSNAVKYNRAGGSVTVGATTVTGPTFGVAVEVAISVTDTGRGIAVSDLPRLFVPFDRLDVTSQIEGTGIGLALARQLVTLMRGRLDVDSQPGRGSTFTVTLPISQGPRPPPLHPVA